MLALLPFADFRKSAAAFFDDTLIQQLQEVDSILNVIHKTDKDESSWDYSPSVLMWVDFVPQLCAYGLALVDEALDRRDIILSVMSKVYEESISWHLQCATCGQFSLVVPSWFGLPEFHKSHQAELIRRNDKYDPMFEVGSDVPLYWPVVKI